MQLQPKQPGTYISLPEQDYRADPAISKSDLDKVASPLGAINYEWGEDKDETPSMRLGTLAHMRLLEPERWMKTKVRDLPIEDHHLVTADHIQSALRNIPETERKKLGIKLTGKKEELIQRLRDCNPEAPIYDVLRERHASGKDIVSIDEYDRCEAMFESLYAHPLAKELVQHCTMQEVSCFWEHPEFPGVMGKCRFDLLGEEIGVDIKKVAPGKATPEGFGHSCSAFRYPIQADYYMYGSECLGKPLSGFYFIVIEERPSLRPGNPLGMTHVVQVYDMDQIPQLLEQSRQMWMEDMRILTECSRMNYWPSLLSMHATSPNIGSKFFKQDSRQRLMEMIRTEAGRRNQELFQRSEDLAAVVAYDEGF